MWIEELPNGKYKYVERYVDNLTGKQKKVSITHDKRNASVMKEMPLLLAEKMKKLLKTKESDITFQELSQKWFKLYTKQVKASTSINIRDRLSVINAGIGNCKLSALSPATINQFILNHLTVTNSTYRTGQANKSVILRVIDYGIQYGYCIDKNYHSLVKVPKINLSKKNELKYLEREELRTILNQMEQDGRLELSLMCQLQVMTGMRFNEMTALDIERDIDLENQLIHINHNYDPRNDVFTSPKTGDARTIYINSDAVNVIKQLLSIRLTKIMRYNLNRDNTLLFRQNRGERPKNIRTVNVLLKKHSINGKEISTHIFRHTFITYMIEDGVDINLIAKHVGHSSVKMIQEVYSHFTDKMDENLKNVILKFKIG